VVAKSSEVDQAFELELEAVELCRAIVRYELLDKPCDDVVRVIAFDYLRQPARNDHKEESAD